MMDGLERFLRDLFQRGLVRFEEPPAPARPGDPGALGVLRQAFEAARLEVAGPRVGFQPGVALAAAEMVRQSAWAVLYRYEPPEVLERRLPRPVAPSAASEHLSADVTLRYLPAVWERARAVDPEDVLLDRLAGWLRACPLSGVLASELKGPEESPDFGGHEGLAMLYAERLARNPRADGRPEGVARAYADWLLGEVDAGVWVDE